MWPPRHYRSLLGNRSLQPATGRPRRTFVRRTPPLPLTTIAIHSRRRPPQVSRLGRGPVRLHALLFFIAGRPSSCIAVTRSNVFCFPLLPDSFILIDVFDNAHLAHTAIASAFASRPSLSLHQTTTTLFPGHLTSFAFQHSFPAGENRGLGTPARRDSTIVTGKCQIICKAVVGTGPVSVGTPGQIVACPLLMLLPEAV